MLFTLLYCFLGGGGCHKSAYIYSYFKEGIKLNSQVCKKQNICLFFYFYFYIFYFLAALGLRCCTWAFSSCSERELLFVAVHRLLIAVASLVTEHRL